VKKSTNRRRWLANKTTESTDFAFAGVPGSSNKTAWYLSQLTHLKWSGIKAIREHLKKNSLVDQTSAITRIATVQELILKWTAAICDAKESRSRMKGTYLFQKRLYWSNQRRKHYHIDWATYSEL